MAHRVVYAGNRNFTTNVSYNENNFPNKKRKEKRINSAVIFELIATVDLFSSRIPNAIVICNYTRVPDRRTFKTECSELTFTIRCQWKIRVRSGCVRRVWKTNIIRGEQRLHDRYIVHNSFV